MLVRAILQIAPLPGDTVIPRNALSVINGEYYAFVQKGDSGEDADLFGAGSSRSSRRTATWSSSRRGSRSATGW